VLVVTLTRNAEEAVATLPDGREVVVCVVGPAKRKNGENETRIGIKAPRDVELWRGELLEGANDG